MHEVILYVQPVVWAGRRQPQLAARVSFSPQFVRSDTRTLCERRFRTFFGESVPATPTVYAVQVSRLLNTGWR